MSWFFTNFQDKTFYEAVYVSFWKKIQYMDLIIVNSAFNDSYVNNATYIDFSTQDNVINTIMEGTSWSLRATCLLRVNPLISSATLFNRYSDIIIIH